MSDRSVAERLVDGLARVASAGIPPEVRSRCEDLLIDVAGLCVAARSSDYVRALLRSVDAGGPSTAIGHAGGYRPGDAKQSPHVIAAARRHAQAGDVDQQLLAAGPDPLGNALRRYRRELFDEPLGD